MIETTVYFDGNDLSQLDGISIFDHDFNMLPDRDIKINKLARADRSIITSAEYTSKPITVQGMAEACDRYDAEEAFQNLRSFLQRPNRTLLVVQGASTLQYTATLSSDSYKWIANNLMFTLEFTASDPIGYESTTTDEGSTNITTASQSIAFDVEGSFKALPVITFDINSVTGGTSAAVTIQNSRTGQGITLTRTWTAADIAIIDSYEKTVTINGADSDFTGTFPTFDPGSQIISYTDAFTTRSVDVAVEYVKRFV